MRLAKFNALGEIYSVLILTEKDLINGQADLTSFRGKFNLMRVASFVIALRGPYYVILKTRFYESTRGYAQLLRFAENLDQKTLGHLAEFDASSDHTNILAHFWNENEPTTPAGLWQPIETAPKDGTEILAYREDCGVFIAVHTSPSEFLSEREYEELGDITDQSDWFSHGLVSGERLEADMAPTHWLPLPPGPFKY